MLRGFVASEPMVRATERGIFVRIRLATVEPIKHSSGKMLRHTEWHTVNFWGEGAEQIDRKVQIGTPLYVEGALRTREWVGRDGLKNRTTDISADKFEILEAIEGQEIPEAIRSIMPQPEADNNIQAAKYEVKAPADDPDNIPF